MASGQITPALKQRIASGTVPGRLMAEMVMVCQLAKGAPLAAYEGEYLKIKEAGKMPGLVMNCKVEWKE